jgi:T-complex protein 10 C-terminus
MNCSGYGLDSGFKHRSIDDDDMSQQAASILQSLDRFTFSSGKSISLSSSKKKKVVRVPDMPRPRRVAFKDDNEHSTMSAIEIDSIDYPGDDNRINSPSTEFQTIPTILRNNRNESSSVIGESILEDDIPCLPLHLTTTKNFKEESGATEVVSNIINNCTTSEHDKDTDLSINGEALEFCLIQDAWSERERVRNWFNEVRQSVQTWVHENQFLLDLKSKQIDQDATASNEAIHRYQNEINDATKMIDNLRQEMSQTIEHHQRVEKNLLSIIENLQLELEKKRGANAASNDLSASSTTSTAKENRQPIDIIDNSPYNVENTSSGKKTHLQGGDDTKPLKSIIQSVWTPSRSTRSSNFNNPTPRISPDSCTPVSVVNSVSLKTNTSDDVTVTRSRTRQQMRHVSEDGSVVEIVQYGNGSRKEVHPDGLNVIWFPNGDIQASSRDGSVAYYYADQAVIEIRHPDGSREYEFPNGQKERHYVDGTKVVAYPRVVASIQENNTKSTPV